MRIRLYMALTLTVGKTVALSRLVADTPGRECSLNDADTRLTGQTTTTRIESHRRT